MGHRKWSDLGWREIGGAQMVKEHDELYDAYKNGEKWRTECMDENNRLDRELDEARQAQDNLIFQRNDFRHWLKNEEKKVADLTAELDEARKRIAELESPIRVPFSDAQIEAMAEAAHNAYSDYWIAQDFPKLDYPREQLFRRWNQEGDHRKASYIAAIRAALAAGGLEPCAVPDYDPDDVALAPTGTVLCDGLVEAERKVENQRMSLRQMHEARERDARLIAELRAEVDEDNAAAASVNDLLVQVQNLTAERDAQEIELADLRFYQREFAAVSAERDALRERASVPQPSSNTGQLPPADQVEALARVLREASTGNKNNQPAAGIWIKEARAAIAHLNTRPEGLPTADEFNTHFASIDCGLFEHEVIELIYDYLRPWLRDPVGCELDVHPDQLELYKWVTEPDGGYEYAAQQAIDLCRSRIRPVFECKECAKLRDEVTFWKRENVASNNKMLAARAALDGE